MILVTGGFGGVGSALAEGMARSLRARVALLGRAPLPAPEDWDAWLTEHGEADDTSRRILCARRVEAAGGRVLALTGDVSEPADVERVVRQIDETFGALHAVVHAAGLPGSGLMALKTRAAARAVMNPKVRGTRVLEEALADRDLDLFLVCSSLATVLDGVGQVDYFAANAFLDAWAVARSRADENSSAGSRTRYVSVGWEAWRDVGMAAQTVVPELLQKGREEALSSGLSSDEGRGVLPHVLAMDLPQVLVSTRDLEVRIRDQADETLQFTDARDGASDGPGSAPANGGAHPRPDLATAFVEPATETEAGLASMWSGLLGVDRVGTDDDFFELGGNSLLLMQVSVQLRSSFEVALSMRELFDTPTVGLLAQRVDSMRMLAGGASSPADSGDSGETEELRL